ncbi:MAG: DEAD/DEAH box helicase family protein [Bacillota bacterium]
MSFKDLNIKIKYRSSDDNIVSDFYIPILDNSKLYKRAVGFFSSSSLLQISKGITGLLENNGEIKLIASPELNEKDVEAINKGYKDRGQVIQNSLMRNLKAPKNYYEEERFNIIAHLIANNFLDVKIAYYEEKGIGLYHEKIGIVYDNDNNRIAFTGSLNDSETAFIKNFESIDVFCDWVGDESKERVIDKEKDFDQMWNNNTNKIKIIDFPDAVKEEIIKYKKNSIDYDIDKKEYSTMIKEDTTNKFNNIPRLPNDIELYEYQKKAIKNWESQDHQGIFDMATGTGKTYTALGGVVSLYKNKNKLAIIIVCPYQHLVDQWVEDIKRFNMKPIIGYSNSSQKNWKNKLKNTIFDYNLDIKNTFCFVTTNATYSSEFVQNQLNKIKKNVLLIGDEAHNLGAEEISKKLNESFEFRLALSATIVRNRDEEGTKKLLDYFGDKCIEYGLEKAIKEGYLSKYYYYPNLVNLTYDELQEYRRLSKNIAKCLVSKNGKTKLNKSGKYYAIKRARLIAGASQKLEVLKKIISDNYCNKKHMLVYCGATTVEDYDYKYNKINKNEIRQITAVTDILGNELDMRVAQFTSKEDSNERKIIKQEFKTGDTLQALIAIRCLDEGVNIPNIKTAFILASSTNPKEYIQRRGRVLRLSDNKDFAEIYDFVTLPRPLEDLYNFSTEELNKDKTLIQNEIKRIKDFSELSSNPHEGLKIINKLKEVYNLWGDRK